MTYIVPLSFTVPGKPISQPRQRHRLVFPSVASIPWNLPPVALIAWLRSKIFIQNYTPANHPVTTYKEAVVLTALVAHDGPKITAPVMLDVTFVMPRPQAITWKTRPMPRLWCNKKPDIDNLLKSVLDAIQSVIIVNDKQVVQVSAGRVLRGKEPCTEITVSRFVELEGK